ncbi:LysR family transcriptional regulator [Bradyrhizobium sp. dw_78]|uniref:LysR family transcriptional regulator n=1 Tax=Bradyrhizobium sp. dw_78 TaxID=2719793 RepID=UPI001BD4224D|nr:LysR family transcriptional regulator [Bradyrhizobium sp. dw_78]
MRPRSLDLNLLVMLEALVAERSVSGAALRLGLTQSAVSHALRRLRNNFKDELFIRSSRGMQPTQRAMEIADATRVAIENIGAVIEQSKTFDPATAMRSFRLRISEYVSSHLLQRLCPVLRRIAPGIHVNAAHFSGDRHENEIVGDEIHIRLGESPQLAGRDDTMRVMEERFVVLMNRKNPLRSKKMTLALYASLSHVKVAGTIGTNVIDDALKVRGLRREIAFQVPSWRDARHIVAATDLVAAIPARWALDRDTSHRCVTSPFPLNDVTFAIDLEWHSRFSRDPAHAWMRQLISEQFR